MFSRYFKFYFATVVLAVATVFFGCENDLIPSPEIDKIIDSGGTSINEAVKPPAGLTASHGGYKSVTLSWNAAANAVRYNIYGAANPFETFVKVGETKDASSSIELDEVAGAVRYYYVKSIDYKGGESFASSTVKGSTMATPSITMIESSSDGTQATVSWWMSNCDSTTYSDSVKYKVRCFLEDGKSVDETTCDGTVSSVVFKGLSPKTKYLYDVGSYIPVNAAEENKYEWSDRIDSETARKLIPDAAKEFTATQGTLYTKVELSWLLPDFVDAKVSSSLFNRNPVYFTIERKEKDSVSQEWTCIVPYIGSCLTSAEKIPGGIVFDCASLSSENVNVKLEAGTLENAETSETYTGYIPGTKIYYCDTSAVAGVKYEYRIISFTDDSKNAVSSENSRSVCEGWSLSTPSFETSAVYEKADDGSTLHSAVKVEYKFDFDTLGLDETYGYVITSQRTPLSADEAAGEEVFEGYWTDEASVNSAAKTFAFDATDEAANSLLEGYYKFKAYVVPAGMNSVPAGEDEYFARAEAFGVVTVVHDSANLPSVTGFSVEDGYSDKFKIKWDYNSNYDYVLKWIPYEGETALAEESLALSKEELNALAAKSSDGSVTYEHAALSGDRRKYMLEASAGFSITKKADSVSETLGTAVPYCTQYFYDKIVVSWKTVQLAKSDAADFTVNAYYKDDETKTPVVDFAGGNGAVVFDETAGIYTCTLEKPAGYDDVLRSGKTILFAVTAASSKTSDTTEAVFATATLGPALVNARVAAPSSEEIVLEWNAVKGAAGYIIRRALYSDGTAAAVDKADTYFYDCEKCVLTVGGESVDEARATVSKTEADGATVYSLCDKYAAVSDSDNKNPYQNNQARIAWGLPFGYAVIPVAAESDFSFTDGFVLDASSKVDYCTKTDETGAVTSTALADVKGACFGYALNLKAQKAEQGDSQRVDWELPYLSASGIEQKVPSLYRREVLENASFGSWERIAAVTVPLKADSVYATYRVPEADREKAFEYAVNYNPGTAEFKKEFVDYCENKKEENGGRYTYPEGVECESEFKGYLLYDDNYSVAYDAETDSSKPEYYAERVTIGNWNKNARALGPDTYTVSILNNNLGSEWIPVLTFNAADFTATTKADDIGFSLTEGTLEARLYPKAIAEGTAQTTEGALKVLRDARHYYKITLTRGEHSAVVDNDVYAYRQITAEELVRAATLAMAVGMKNTGASWKTYNSSGSYTESTPGSGTASVSSSGGGGKTNFVHTITFDSLTPSLITKADKTVTFLSLSGTVTGETWKSWQVVNLFYYPAEYMNYGSTKVSVSSGTEFGGLYSADLKFFWLNKEETPRYTESEGYKGIKVTYPSGAQEVVFGNITPLPFIDDDFKIDTTDWQ